MKTPSGFGLSGMLILQSDPELILDKSLDCGSPAAAFPPQPAVETFLKHSRVPTIHSQQQAAEIKAAAGLPQSKESYLKASAASTSSSVRQA